MKKINLLGLLTLLPIITLADTAWTTGHYSNNANISKKLSIASAEALKIKIVGTTEKNYDFITIKDENGNSLGKFSGTINKVIETGGSSIVATLTSDYSVTKSGVTVTIEKLIDDSNVIKWSTGAYKNNERRVYKITLPDGFCQKESKEDGYCAIDLNGETEKDYDFVMLADDKGKKLGSFTGKITPNSSLGYAQHTDFGYNTRYITVTLISDASITKSGMNITIVPAALHP